MSKTREQLINQSLLNLGVIAEGQSISTEDMNKMDGIVDPAIAQLSALDVYYVSDPGALGPSGGEIPDEAFLSIAKYIANEACSAFNLPADQKMQAMAVDAVDKLRIITAPTRTLRYLKVDPAVRRVRRWYNIRSTT